MIRGTFGTILLTTLLALLVWVWAEGESLSEERVTTPLVVGGTAQLNAEVIDPNWRGSVMVRMHGSTASLAAARKELLRSPLELPLGLGGMPATAGDHTLDLLSVIRAQPSMDRLGVSVVEVEPSRLRVRIREKK